MTGEGSRARDLSLPELGALCVEGGTLAAHLTRRLELRGEELEFRSRANRRRVLARTTDNLAKFGGGSLLTATLGLLIAGSSDSPVVGLAILTLLSFLVGTINDNGFRGSGRSRRTFGGTACRSAQGDGVMSVSEAIFIVALLFTVITTSGLIAAYLWLRRDDRKAMERERRY